MTHIANIEEQKLMLQQDLHVITQDYLHKYCTKEVVTSNDHQNYPFLYGKYALLTSPIEPSNDIHVILETFLKFSEYPIVICGDWKANSYAEALYEKYSQNKAIHLLEIITDHRILNMLRSNCYVFLDAYYQPNNDWSLIEAMYMQLPVIAYASPYNFNLTSNKAMYYKMPTELLEALKSLHPTKASEIGKSMKEVIHGKIYTQQHKPENKIMQSSERHHAANHN